MNRQTEEYVEGVVQRWLETTGEETHWEIRMSPDAMRTMLHAVAVIAEQNIKGNIPKEVTTSESQAINPTPAQA